MGRHRDEATSLLRLSRGSGGSRTGGSTFSVTTADWTSQPYPNPCCTLKYSEDFHFFLLFILPSNRLCSVSQLQRSCWPPVTFARGRVLTFTLWSALFEFRWYMHKRREKQGRQYLNYRNLNYSKCNSSEATGQLCFASHKLTQTLPQPEGGERENAKDKEFR